MSIILSQNNNRFIRSTRLLSFELIFLTVEAEEYWNEIAYLNCEYICRKNIIKTLCIFEFKIVQN